MISASLFPTGINLLSLPAIIIGLVILWIIVSIPVYLAGKIVTGGRSTLGEAMAATVLGPIVYFIVLTGVGFFLEGILGGVASTLGYILAFVAWIWVYKHTFETGWLGGLAIAILAVVVFVAFGLVISALLGIIAPSVSSGTPLMSLSSYVSLSLNVWYVHGCWSLVDARCVVFFWANGEKRASKTVRFRYWSSIFLLHIC